MPIRTLADISSSGSSDVGSPTVRVSATEASLKNAASLQQSINKDSLTFKCCHIPSLPDSKQAEELLLRVVREFQPIITRRNYNVKSISELCCCNDGLDFEPGNRRKRRLMSNNIWGYNQTTTGYGKKSHTIHIRLRHARDHKRFLPYEDVAGTLAHELSHCVHSPHNKDFYKLMDDILDEHAALMTSQLRNGGAPMTAFTGNGNKLGGANGLTGVPVGGKSRLITEEQKGYTLGGDKFFTNWMTPAEAAVAAAEARRRQQQLRLRGEHCCRPCTIDLSNEDDNESIIDHTEPSSNQPEQENKSGAAASKRSRDDNDENVKPSSSNKKSVAVSASELTKSTCIDLTSDCEEDKKPKSSVNPLQEWSCFKCTYINRPMALACDICATERNSFRFEK